MPPAKKMSVVGTPEMARALHAAVENGDYVSTSEALVDAVMIWQRQRTDDAERLASMRSRVRRSLDDPRPDMSESDLDRRLSDLHSSTVRAGTGETV